MYLYEIKAASFAHQLNELASADIDGDLEKAAGEISKATGAGQDDETAGMGGDDFGAAPNPEAGASPMQMGDEGDELATDDPLASTETDEEEDEMLMQKVDSVLVSAAKGHPYTRNYSHDDKSKIHPYKILSMQMDELQSLRTMARNKANIESFNGDIGSMDNPEIKFFQDLVSYVDKLIEVKKSATKEYTDGKQGKNAKKPEQSPEPKTKAGKAKMPKVGESRISNSARSDMLGRALNAIERGQFSDEPEMEAKADKAMDALTNRTISKKELEYWASRDEEWESLHSDI